jgi:ankyrin repeat protein
MDIDSVHSVRDEGAIFPATPLWYAYAKGENDALLRSLLERGASPENCMFAIAWYDDVEAAELFKRHGADLNPLAGSQTPFHAAFLWRRFAVAEWFLRNGADVNHADAEGNTALFYAIKRRYDTEPIRMLLRFGADPDLANAAGLSPRTLAAQNHRRQILELLDTAARA